MSKKEEQITTNVKPEQEKSEKKYSKLQWFFFVIVIPFLFAITIGLVVMTIAGLNVFDMFQKYGEKIPVVSTMTKKSETNPDKIAENMANLKATIEDQKAEISKLKSEIKNKQADYDASQKEIENLKEQLKASQDKKKEAAIKLEELAKVYETMSTKKSAAILSAMDNNDVVDIILKMKNEARAAILEKMEPAKAAELTTLIKSKEEKANADMASEQEQAQN